MLDTLYQILISLGYISPIHPPLTHIPIGLLTGALVFGLMARFFPSEKLAAAARACTILALIFSFMTIVFGAMDWQHYYSGGWLHPIKMKLMASGFLVGLLIVAVILGQGARHQNSAVLVVYTLCFLVVVVLGWFGDKLTYRARIDAFPTQSHPGAILFVNNCYGCHPDGGNLVAPEKALRKSEVLSIFPLFRAWVRRPDPPMPRFSPSRLSDQQAQVLYDYLIDFLWIPQRPDAQTPAAPAADEGGNKT